MKRVFSTQADIDEALREGIISVDQAKQLKNTLLKMAEDEIIYDTVTQKIELVYFDDWFEH